MKLVAIMCVEEYVDKARKLLYDLNVKAFSESEMQGYKFREKKSEAPWFSHNKELTSSHIIFTMVNNEKAKEVMSAVKECGKELINNPVHAFQLNIEKAF